MSGQLAFGIWVMFVTFAFAILYPQYFHWLLLAAYLLRGFDYVHEAIGRMRRFHSEDHDGWKRDLEEYEKTGKPPDDL